MITLLWIVFIYALLVHLGYWVLLLRRLHNPQSTENIDDVPVSIVTCFKNEAENLQKLVEHLIQQKATSEIVLVDDFSTDDSAQVALKSSNDKIKIVQPDTDRPGKKTALYKGVQTASQESLLLTDADCAPASSEWALIMSRKSYKHNAVLGYAPMQKRKGIIPTFARYETYLTAIQYLSYALAGIPYMGVGRNMLVKKSQTLPILDRLQHDGIASGDDDLLIQNIKPPITIELDPKTFVYSDPPMSLRAYIRQKSRHISTSTHYKLHHQLLLGVFAGSHILTYLIGIILAFFNVKLVLIAFLIKWITQSLINVKLMRLLDERDLFWKFPMLDIATFAYYIILTPYLAFKNTSRWN